MITAPPSKQDHHDSLYKNYTPQGQHPEDRIYADKQYINRLQKHMEQVFQQLASDLRINKEGKEMLFDFVFNEEQPMEFSDMLSKAGLAYSSLVEAR